MLALSKVTHFKPIDVNIALSPLHSQLPYLYFVKTLRYLEKIPFCIELYRFYIFIPDSDSNIFKNPIQ